MKRNGSTEDSLDDVFGDSNELFIVDFGDDGGIEASSASRRPVTADFPQEHFEADDGVAELAVMPETGAGADAAPAEIEAADPSIPEALPVVLPVAAPVAPIPANVAQDTNDDPSSSDGTGEYAPSAQAPAGEVPDLDRHVAGTGIDPALEDPMEALLDQTSQVYRNILSPDGERGPLSGASWDAYEIGDLLGQGGMASVYLARRKVDGVLVALKVLPGHLAGDEQSRSRFLLEAKAAQRLTSQNVVRVFNVGTFEHLLFFEMEYVRGTHLGTIIKDHKNRRSLIPIGPVLEWLEQAANGLADAFHHKFVHRDIKPANLLLTDDGIVKVADFGIVKMMDEESLTMTGIALGTPLYMSPEQGRGDDIDQRADVYSFGVVAYQLLAGVVPFQGSTADAIIYQHHFAEPDRLKDLRDDLPPGLEELVFKCLHKQPDKRFNDPDEILADLRRIRIGEKPELAVFPGGRISTGAAEALADQQGWSRHRWLLMAVAGLVLIVLTRLGQWWWEDRVSTIQGLEQSLASLNLPVPPPEDAAARVDELASYLGEDHPDIRRWRAKLATIPALQQQLRAVDLDDLDHDTFVMARAETDRLERLVGSTDPVVSEWQARLSDFEDRLQQLRRELAADTGSDLLPRPRHPTVRAFVQVATIVLGSDHQEVVGWRSRLVQAEASIAGLVERLQQVDAPVEPPRSRQAELRATLDRYDTLVSEKDPDLLRWRRILDGWDRSFVALREALAAIDAGVHTPVQVADDLADELERYRGLVGDEDPDLQRWLRRIAAGRERLAVVRSSLAEVMDTELLSADQLSAAERDLEELQSLAGTSDADLRRWRPSIIQQRRELDTRLALLADLTGREQLSIDEQHLLSETIAALVDRQAIDPSHRQQLAQMLAAEAARLTVLRKQLTLLDRRVDFGPETVKQFTQFQLLVRPDDPDLQRWRVKVDSVAQLRRQLAALDRAATPPADADDKLQELGELIGAESGTLPTWRDKLARIQALRQELVVIDEPVVPPSEVRDLLPRYVALVGSDDPDAVRWQQRLARLDHLLAWADGLDRRLQPPEDGDAAVAELAGLLGDEHPVVSRSRARLQQLRGPPDPVWAETSGQDDFGRWAILPIGEVALRFRYVPGGRFRIGSPDTEPGHEVDERQTTATISGGFWLAETETTQRQWQAVLPAQEFFRPDPDHPADRVSQRDVLAFIDRLADDLPEAVVVRLPTEAEWEWACRAGHDGPVPPSGLSGITDLSQIAIFDRQAVGSPMAVGSRHPNALGLRDMLGNVWEWCADGYAPYPVNPVLDPFGEGRHGVVRGGSWSNRANALRVANRHRLSRDTRSAYVGFRLLIEARFQPTSQEATASRMEVAE